MEIHAPHGTVRSLKDFSVHILIVTLGILIALSLDGVRESVHEHRVVREARANFRSELLANQSNLKLETENVTRLKQELDQIIADLPQLERHPEQLTARVSALRGPSLYYFTTDNWDAALTSGALAHMDTAEVQRLAGAYIVTRSYLDMERQVLPVWFSLQSYFNSRRPLRPQEAGEGIERLQMMAMYESVMLHVAQEFTAGTEDALNDSKPGAATPQVHP